jgi:hypothetical protein
MLEGLDLTNTTPAVLLMSLWVVMLTELFKNLVMALRKGHAPPSHHDYVWRMAPSVIALATSAWLYYKGLVDFDNAAAMTVLPGLFSPIFYAYVRREIKSRLKKD